MSKIRLSAEERYATCIHEAGHAVISALGGIFVYRVCVAPEGATEWSFTGRKGDLIGDLWGLCEKSGCPGSLFIHWNKEQFEFEVDIDGFRDLLNLPGNRNATYREIRAHICASFAGPAAERLYIGEDEIVPDYGDLSGPDDIGVANALCHLLPNPWSRERQRLTEQTVAALQQEAVWAKVTALANALVESGEVCELSSFLPTAQSRWPRPHARLAGPRKPASQRA